MQKSFTRAKTITKHNISCFLYSRRHQHESHRPWDKIRTMPDRK
jgi:hypothetical protein